MKPPPPNREVIAYHEAGHAVMRVHVGRPLGFLDIERATDDSGRPCLGCVHPGEPLSDEQRADWWVDVGEVLVSLAGSAAQEKYTGFRDDYHSGSDRSNAMAVIQQCAGSLTNDSPLVKRLVNAAHEECRWRFDNNALLWRQVEFVATELIEKGRLEAKEVKTMMSRACCAD